MPIRLNLLAEAQAAEDARRRDPVKRAVWLAVLAVVLILVWSSSLQLKAMLLRSDVTHLEARISSYTNEYRVVLEDRSRATDMESRANALQRLSAYRLLTGTLLNSLQQTTVEDVQLIRFRLEQSYAIAEGTKTRTNDNNVVIKGKPATSTEKTMLKLEGTDSSANPGDQLTRYKSALAANTYFKQALVKTNAISLKNLSPPQLSPLTGKQSVNFSLECLYPEITR